MTSGRDTSRSLAQRPLAERLLYTAFLPLVGGGTHAHAQDVVRTGELIPTKEDSHEKRPE